MKNMPTSIYIHWHLFTQQQVGRAGDAMLEGS